EGLVHLSDGTPVKGVHPENRYVPLRDGQTKIDFYIEAAANPDVMATNFEPTRVGDCDSAGDEPIYTLGQVEVLELDEDVYGLIPDLEVAGELAEALPVEGARRWQLTAAIGQTLDALDLQDLSGTAARARKVLAPALALPAAASAHRITAVGHAH